MTVIRKNSEKLLRKVSEKSALVAASLLTQLLSSAGLPKRFLLGKRVLSVLLPTLRNPFSEMSCNFAKYEATDANLSDTDTLDTADATKCCTLSRLFLRQV